MPPNELVFGVADAVAVINQTLEYAYPFIAVVGEVANFSQRSGKWVFFDLKDDEMSLKCFMPAWNLRVGIEDGMQLQVIAKPRLGRYGFSLNVEAVKPVGEGSIKKAFELLRAKLDAEGLFAPERKRALPWLPERIGVISSTDAAGYKDFMKITGQRFGGLVVKVADVMVQGDEAADQIIHAINFFNESEDPPEVIAVIRGGGSRDDLVAFDDERLVRAIAASRVPILTGVGHEVDVTLSDMAADVRASTPSNAAEIVVPDRREVTKQLDSRLGYVIEKTENKLNKIFDQVTNGQNTLLRAVNYRLDEAENQLKHLLMTLRQLDPNSVLRRGYAMVRDAGGRLVRDAKIGDKLTIENDVKIINVGVENVRAK